MPKTSQLSNGLMTFKSCGQGFRLGRKKSSHNGKTLEVLGTPPIPLSPPFPPIYPTVKETSPGTWCGVCGIPGPEVGVLEDVWSMDLGYGTLPDLLANYDGTNHSFLTNRVAISGQSGGSYRTDASKL